jgi:hypothetical protein
VRHRHPHLRADERAGQSRVDVADDEHPVRPLFEDDRLETLHHGRRLLRVGAGADAEVYVGTGQPEVAEEVVAHPRVVVLPGVYDQRRELPRAPPHRLHQRRDLHKIRPRPHDVDDFEHYS